MEASSKECARQAMLNNMLKTEYNNDDKEVYGRVFQIRGYSTIISTPPLKHCVTT